MSDPIPATGSTTFDLGTIARELRSDPAYARDGHSARTLLRQPDLRIVLVAMRAGTAIKEHRAHETASIHVIEGRIRLQLRDTQSELGRDQLLALAADVPHDVRAIEQSAFVLTLGWRGAAVTTTP